MPRIATIGMFDGVHRGHRLLVDELCRRGAAFGYTPIVFTFADHPLREIAPAKCPPLLTDIDTKRALLQTLLPASGAVEVLEFDEAMRTMTAAAFIAMLRDRYRVRAIVRGHDHTFGHDRPDADTLAKIARAAHVDMYTAPVLHDDITGAAICSSVIRQAIVEQGDMAAAERMLGRPYDIHGTVVKGSQIGRTIGFPTANILPDSRIAIPRNGVYAATIDVAPLSCDSTAPLPCDSIAPLSFGCIAPLSSGCIAPLSSAGAMVNIGTAPTVSQGNTPRVRIEAHIFDFEGDIYGAQVILQPRAYLRAEQRFAGIDALAARLRDDALAARAILNSR